MMTQIRKIYRGKVIHGAGIGKKIGYPTANIQLDDNTNLIPNGVYAVEVTIKKEQFRGMLYVGTRPTLNLPGISIEINIFDFSGDIYNQYIEFIILKKIRDELTFQSTEELINQIKKDQYEIMEYFEN